MAVKIKNHSGASKRFRKTAGGYKRKKANLRHNMRKRSQAAKRVLRKKTIVTAADAQRVAAMLPNG
jgi:large subunit ribosomal protein L35